MNQDHLYFSKNSQDASAGTQPADLAQQKPISQAELYQLSQRLTAMFKEKLKQDSFPLIPSDQASRRRNQDQLSFDNTPPFSISPKEQPHAQTDRNQDIQHVYPAVATSTTSEKQFNIMVPTSQIQPASFSQERKHNFNPLKRKAPVAGKSAALRSSVGSKTARNPTVGKTVGSKPSLNRSQYLTVQRGKGTKPQTRSTDRKKKSLGRPKAKETRRQTSSRDAEPAQHEQVTRSLRDSLKYFMSQEPIVGGESADLDNTAITGDLNQTHITYQTNTDGNASSLINIKDHKDYDLSLRANSGERAGSLAKGQKTSSNRKVSGRRDDSVIQSDLKMFNTFHGGLSTEPDILQNQQSLDQAISIKEFTTANPNLSLISIEDELEGKLNSAREGYATQQTQNISQSSKESSQQFNQLWQFSQNLNNQIEKIRRKSSLSKDKRKYSTSDSKDSALVAASAKTQKELVQYQNQVINLKYEINVLQKRLQQQETAQPDPHDNLKYIHHLLRERQIDQKLIQKINRQEDQHQADILSKSEIIKDLTSKLKRSTQIISQLYEAAAQKDKQFRETLRAALQRRTEELEGKQLEEIQAVKEDYERQTVALTVERDLAREAESKLKGQVQELKKAGKGATDTVKMRELQKKLQESQNMVNDQQEQMEQMSQEIMEKDAEIESMMERLKKLELLEKDKKSWNTERRQMEQQLKKVKEQKQANEDELNERIQDLNQSIESLQEQLQESKEQNVGDDSQLQTQLSRLEEQIDLMESRKADEIGQLMGEGEKQKQGLEDLLKAKEKQLQQHTAQLGEKDAELAEQAEQLQTLEEENEDLNRQIEELNRQMTSKNKDFQALQSTLTDKDEQISKKDFQLDEKNQQLESKHRELGHLRLESEDQVQQLATKAQTISNLTEQVEQLQKSINDIHKEHTFERQHSQRSMNDAEQLKMQLDLLKIEQSQQELVIIQQKERIAQLEELDKSKSEAYHQVQEAKEILDRQVEALNEQKQEVEASLNERTKELQQAQEQYSQKVQRLASSHQSSLSELKQQNADQLKHEEDISSALQKDNIELKGELEQARLKMQEGQRTEETILQKAKEAEEESRRQIKELEQELKWLRQECEAQKAEIRNLKEESSGERETAGKVQALANENKVFKSTIEDMAQQLAKVEGQRVSLEQELKGKTDEIKRMSKPTETQSRYTSPKSDKERQELSKHVDKLLQEKEDLTKLILTMRQNLKGVRKVFLNQVVREGVEAQNQLSRVLHSQSSRESFVDSSVLPDLNNSRLLAVPAIAHDSSDDEINLFSIQKVGRSGGVSSNSAQRLHDPDLDANGSMGGHGSGGSSLNSSMHNIRSTPSIEVSAMYRKIEEEKRKFDEGVNCMQQIQIQQTEQLKEKQNQQQKKSQQILDLEKQLHELTQSKTMQQNASEETEAKTKKLQDEIEAKSAECTKQEQANQKLQEQIKRMQEEFQAQVQAMSLGFQEELARKDRDKDGKDGNTPTTMRRAQSEQVLEDKVKKLEYMSKQSDRDFEALQQTLTNEVQKRQEVIAEAREKDDKINDLLSDVKHLSEEMEAKDDEVMHAYQRYKKELAAKDKEIESMKQTVKQLMDHVSSGESKATPQELKKLRQEIEHEVMMTLTDDFNTQINALKQQMDAQQKKHEDQLYDKDAEIDNIKRTISQKDAKINDLQVKLDLTRQAAEEGNDKDELGEFLEDAEGQGYQVNTTTPRGFQGQESNDVYDLQMSNARSQRISNPHQYGSPASGLVSGRKPSHDINDLVDVADMDAEAEVVEEESPLLSQFQMGILETTPKNREIVDDSNKKYDSMKRQATLSPSEMQFFKNRLGGDIPQTEPRSNKKMKELTQEKQELENDILRLRDKLDGQVNENQILQVEVDNLRQALAESNALLQESSSPPPNQKVQELEAQLKNKDVIIEQLSNQIVALNMQGNDQQQQIKKQVQRRVSQIMSKPPNESSQEKLSVASSLDRSPAPNRAAFRNSKLKLNGSFLQSEESTPAKSNDKPSEQSSESKAQRKGRKRGRLF